VVQLRGGRAGHGRLPDARRAAQERAAGGSDPDPDACFRLFARGTELAAQRGLILVDTKYELGLLGDEIVLMDEVHTPDSSRYWYADTYDELFRKNKDQRALHKEPLREWLAERGFRGDGAAPVLTDEVRIATAS
jgi:phosphoribosylaminoimidazole-succinocarboxamide synthase